MEVNGIGLDEIHGCRRSRREGLGLNSGALQQLQAWEMRRNQRLGRVARKVGSCGPGAKRESASRRRELNFRRRERWPVPLRGQVDADWETATEFSNMGTVPLTRGQFRALVGAGLE